jgi:hypothetical protein
MLTLSPGLRKLALTAHVAVSVGWLGSIGPYLALAIAGLNSHDAQVVRSAYIAMELIGWFVIVPLSFAALVSGLVQSLVSPWGFIRHWWILVKIALTTVATAVLVVHMQTVSHMSRIAADMALSQTDYRALRIQLVVHAAGGLAVLLAVTALSVFKPWGMTPYGKRVALRGGLLAQTRDRATVIAPARSTTSTPHWGRIARIHAIHAAALVLVFIVLRHAGMFGGIPHH